jgi:hypothetical protein
VEIHELLIFVTDVFDQLAIRYFVTGSNASILYGEPRLTNDIDIVADIAVRDVDEVIAQFPSGDFYISRPAFVDAIVRQSMFNIIHIPTSYKVDVVIAPPSAFLQSQFARSKRVAIREGQTVYVCSPEDVILNKLRFYKMGQSDKHLRDIAGVLRITGEAVDRAYVGEWAERLGLSEIWNAVITKVDGKQSTN